MPTEMAPPDLPPRSPLWSRLPQVTPPTEAQLASVAERLAVRVKRARALRRSALALASAATLVAWLWLRAQPVPPVPAIPSRAESLGGGAPPALAPTVAPPLPKPAVDAAPPKRVVAGPLAGRSKASSNHAAPAPSLTPDAVPAAAPDADDESLLLGEALQRLNRASDPEGALKLIAAYRQRFPKGELAGEAQLVRTKALLRLGRREELVAELTPELIATLPRARELAVLRAEALVQLGRCAQAEPELAALRESADLAPRLLERVRASQAACSVPNEGDAEPGE